jgi:G:T-mismatch repair DNA endonuclease (very short patch repair protein)
MKIEIKQHILETYFCSNGNMSGEKLKKFKLHPCYEEFDNLTSFVTSGVLKEKIYCLLNDIEELPKCFCGNVITHFINAKLGYGKTCSIQCSNKNPDKILMFTKLSLEKYGVDNLSKHPDIINKIKQTKLERHGSETYVNPSKALKTSHTYRFETSKEILAVNNIIPILDGTDSLLSRKYQCTICNDIFEAEEWQKQASYIRCLKCKPKFKSNGEGELHVFLKSIGVDFKIEDRTILKPKELDIVIPDHNLAIEYDGLLWHSYGKHNTSYLNNFDIEDSRYHLNKTKGCIEQNINLLHIFQSEWECPDKQDIWKSLIKSKLGLNERIGARECHIKRIGGSLAYEFLEKNHLQGNKFSSYYIGLFHNNSLVSVLAISGSRFNKSYDWEITRYCNKIGVNVMGGFSRTLAWFRAECFGSIITYADKRYSTGDMYKVCGFTELKDSPPNYFYFTLQEMKLLSRIQFQKHKLKDKLVIFDPLKTEAENMFDNGYRRIWDCGNKVFVLN